MGEHAFCQVAGSQAGLAVDRRRACPPHRPAPSCSQQRPHLGHFRLHWKAIADMGLGEVERLGKFDPHLFNPAQMFLQYSLEGPACSRPYETGQKALKKIRGVAPKERALPELPVSPADARSGRISGSNANVPSHRPIRRRILRCDTLNTEWLSWLLELRECDPPGKPCWMPFIYLARARARSAGRSFLAESTRERPARLFCADGSRDGRRSWRI